jgi:hypothetical protein
MDQAIHPRVELGKGYPLGLADKGLLIGMQKGISINDISKSSSPVTAQFLQYEFVRHAVLLQSCNLFGCQGSISI